MSNPRFAEFEILLDAAHDRAAQCIRCGNSASRHGERPQDSPPGCRWTYAMVLEAASGSPDRIAANADGRWDTWGGDGVGP